MRKRLLIILKIVLALAVALAAYRLWQAITQERVLYAVAQFLLLVFMGAWIVWFGLAMPSLVSQSKTNK